MNHQMLATRGLHVVRDGRTVLSDVHLSVPEGAWLAVIGPNGAGKSTLLKAIAGLLPTAGGEVLAAGAAMRNLRARERARLIAYVPQAPTLPGDMSALNYVLLGRSPYVPYLGRAGSHDRAIVADVLERLDLTTLASRPLAHLSGGERQRVVLARALTQQARILLLDEPTTALDLGHQQQVLELLDELRLADHLTVITTLHDLSQAAQYADALLLLAEGQAVTHGPPAEVLTEELVSTHFGASVRIVPHPETKRPTVVPSRQSHIQRQGHIQR